MANSSRFNATKHGIFAAALGNSKFLGKAGNNFKLTLHGLRNSLKPQNEFEDLQVEKLAFLYLRLARVYKADWALAPKLVAQIKEVLKSSLTVIETAYVEEGEQVARLRRDISPELLIRYESHIERQIVRTIDLLLKFRGDAKSSDGA